MLGLYLTLDVLTRVVVQNIFVFLVLGIGHLVLFVGLEFEAEHFGDELFFFEVGFQVGVGLGVGRGTMTRR